MRTRKATINVGVSILTYIIAFIPMFLVRKIFLDKLGVELLGLSSLYTNIIGYLSIIEMGIGTAIIFSLYKPFAEHNYIKVNGYLNFYKKFYKTIGFIILVLGICTLPFLKFFIKDSINMFDAKLYFILFLINILVTYLFSYKLCILNVDQQSFKVSIGTTLTKLIIAILQIIFLNIYSNFYIFLVIQIIINLIYYIFMDEYINKKFIWLNETKSDISVEEKNTLIKNVKALFLHKIGGVFVCSTDNIVISAFISLTAVAKFNNYNMVILAIQGLIGSAMNTVTPSVGNLLVEDEEKELSYNIYKKLFFLSFWLVSFVVISLFNTITQFVALWMGLDQTLSNITVAVILFNLYFSLMRTPVDEFKEAGGIYYEDRYAPIAEGIINLIFSLILVKLVGLTGVFIGTLISNISVVFWVKPLMIYKHIFKKPLIEYFKMYFKYLAIAFITLLITHLVVNKISLDNSIVAFLMNCIINIVLINFIYFIIFSRCEEFKYFKNIALSSIKCIKNKFSYKFNNG